MTQTTKRRSSLFPFFQADSPLIRTKPAAKVEKPAPTHTAAVDRRQAAGAMITARGQRFSIHQIGSMFGSE